MSNQSLETFAEKFETVNLKIMTRKEIKHLPAKKKMWLVKDLIPVGGTILAGAPKAYKTYLALHIANCLGTRKPVFGKFEVPAKKKILIMDRENSPILIKQRLAQLGFRANCLWSFGTNLASSKGFQEQLLAYLGNEKIEVLIIDSFRRFHAGDENSSEQVAKTFAFLDQIKGLGVSVLLVHHNRKEIPMYRSSVEEMIRGSSDLIAWPDNILCLKKLIEDSTMLLKIEQLSRVSEALSPFTIAVEKPKDNPEGLAFVYHATLPSEIEKPMMATTSIYQLVEEKGIVSRADIHDQLLSAGFGRDLLDKTLSRMEKDNLLIKDTGEKGKYLFRKPTEEEQLLLANQEEKDAYETTQKVFK